MSTQGFLTANAIQKYIDGDFTVLAAEHLAVPPGSEEPTRFGIIHFGRQTRQPLIAAQQGAAQTEGRSKEFFREGDIFVRRGAQSIRANSGDVRLLLEGVAVDEARVRGVDRAWEAVVDVRALLAHVEFVYDMLTVGEYPEALSNPNLAGGIQRLDMIAITDQVARFHRQVLLERPHVGEQLYGLFRLYSAFCGRLLYRTQENREAGRFLAWGENADGTDDGPLLQLVERMLPAANANDLWQKGASYRPLRPLIDHMEQVMVTEMRRVLSGWS